MPVRSVTQPEGRGLESGRRRRPASRPARSGGQQEDYGGRRASRRTFGPPPREASLLDGRRPEIVSPGAAISRRGRPPPVRAYQAVAVIESISDAHRQADRSSRRASPRRSSPPATWSRARCAWRLRRRCGSPLPLILWGWGHRLGDPGATGDRYIRQIEDEERRQRPISRRSPTARPLRQQVEASLAEPADRQLDPLPPAAGLHGGLPAAGRHPRPGVQGPGRSHRPRRRAARRTSCSSSATC